MGLRRFLATGVTTAILAAGILALPASSWAEEKGPNTGRVSISVGSDLTNAYMFRGILQERDGVIWQPTANLAINMYKSDDSIVSSFDVGFGVWASYHSEETLASGGGADPLYEVDYYPSGTVGFSNGISTGVTYYFYTSPNGAFRTVGELSWLTTYDDSAVWGDSGFSLQPSVEFAFEVHRTSFGNGQGIFNGLGLNPNMTFMADSPCALTLSVPLKVGLSVDEYYYDPTNGHPNDTFGFFSAGAKASVALGFIPSDFGAWSAGLGINVYVLGDTLEEVNEGDGIFPVGTFTIAMEY